LGCCLTEDQGETNYIYYKEHCAGAQTDPIDKSVRDHVTKSVKNYNSDANVSPEGKVVLRSAGHPPVKAKRTAKPSVGLRPGDASPWKSWPAKSSTAKSNTAKPETVKPKVPYKSQSVKPHELKSAAPASSEAAAVYTYSNAGCGGRARYKYVKVPLDTCLTIPAVVRRADTVRTEEETAHMKLTRSSQAAVDPVGSNSTGVHYLVYTVLLYPSRDTTCSSAASHQFSTEPHSICTADNNTTTLSDWRSIQVKPEASAEAEETVDCHGAANQTGICSLMETEVHKSAAPRMTEPRFVAVAFVSSVALMLQFAA